MTEIYIGSIGAILSFIPLLWHPTTPMGAHIELIIEVVVWLILIWEFCCMIRRK